MSRRVETSWWPSPFPHRRVPVRSRARPQSMGDPYSEAERFAKQVYRPYHSLEPQASRTTFVGFLETR